MLRITARGGVVALEIAHLKNGVEQGIRRGRKASIILVKRATSQSESCG
jgi:hypothetical protein